jgi:uncharacterized protein
MRILVDISHPAQINFFKPVIYRFKAEGDELLITVLRRGKLPEIAKKELSGCNLKFVGGHKGNKWSIIFEANLLKFFQVFWISIKFFPDAGLSTGSFILGAALKFIGKPNLQFDDDPERTIHVCLEKKTATLLFFPAFYQGSTKRIGSYNALKEWAYLTPSCFVPNSGILDEYSLKPKEYIFIREVDTGSFNYMTQPRWGIAEIIPKFPSGIPVVLSLENKMNAKYYPSQWIILNEPVSDIHSLMYFSRLIISSGDSMAREGAMLGVNSLYCGSRKMQANEYLALHASFKQVNPGELPDAIFDIFHQTDDFVSIQESRRLYLQEKWCDVTAFIYEKFKSILK